MSGRTQNRGDNLNRDTVTIQKQKHTSIQNDTIIFKPDIVVYLAEHAGILVSKIFTFREQILIL